MLHLFAKLSICTLLALFVGLITTSCLETTTYEDKTPQEEPENWIYDLTVTTEWPEDGETGTRAPNFNFTVDYEPMGLDGPVTPESLQGKPLILHFWADDCSSCEYGLEVLGGSYRDFKDQVNFLAVDVGEFVDLVRWSVERDWLVRYSVPVASTIDASVMEKYNVFDIPATVFIDSEGWIFENWRGQLMPDALRHVTNQLLTINAESLTPPESYCDKPTPMTNSWIWEDYRQRVILAQHKLDERLKHNPYFIGAGIGIFYSENGDLSETIGVKVAVSKRHDQATLPPEDRIPGCFNGVPVQAILSMGSNIHDSN